MQPFLYRSSSLSRLGLAILVCWLTYLVYPFFTSSPGGLHFIRQTDSLSFVYGFLKHDFNLFTPSTLNLVSKDGKAACEFPLFYWMAAILSHLGIAPIYALKIVHLLISFTGIIYLYKLLGLIFKSTFLPFLGTTLTASSTIYLYYFSNTLPDAPALGLTFVGLYHSIHFFLYSKEKNLKLALIFFAVASLVKITYGLYSVAFLFTLLFGKQIALKKLVFYSILCLAPSILWAIYSNEYNLSNHSSYFLTHWVPIWILSSAEIDTVLDYLSRFWRSNFYYLSTQHVFVIAYFFHLISYKKVNQSVFVFANVSLLGCLAYLLLFFDKFKDHDYYLMVFIPCFSLLLNLSVSSLENLFIKRSFAKLMLTLSLGVLVVLSANYSRMKLLQRYNREPDNYSIIQRKIMEFDTSILKAPGENSNRILVVGDHTMNGSLVFLGREGLTVPGSKINSNELKDIIFTENIREAMVLDKHFIPDWFESAGFHLLRVERDYEYYTREP